jgi:ABC-type polar amino acid transport system ATPase subunit
MTQTVLEAREVTKAYPRHEVLRGVNLTVAPGQLAAVVGENGAGKSTLLKILAGTLAADRREVQLAGTLGYCHRRAQAAHLQAARHRTGPHRQRRPPDPHNRVAGAFAHTALWDYLALGLAWPATFTAIGLAIFRARTRTRS